MKRAEAEQVLSTWVGSLSEQRFWGLFRHASRAVASAPEGFLCFGRTGAVNGWSAGATQILGFDRRKMVGLHATELPHLEKNHRQDIEAMVKTIFAGTEIRNKQVSRRRSDGTPIELLIDSLPIFQGLEVTGAVTRIQEIKA